jgi:hypothetical protein
MVAFYYSLEGLSARATDFLNTYILPFISLFSILCGLVILLDLNLLILKLQSFTTKKQSHKADQKTFIMFFLFGVISLVVCISSVTLPRSINFIGYLVANRTLNYNESETVIEKSLYLMSKSKMSEDPVFNLIS